MQTLNGIPGVLQAASYAADVGVERIASSNWNFTDDTGAQGTFTIFQVTGDVYIQQIYGLCQTTLAGVGATIELGITGNTAVLIAQTTAADLEQYEVWQDATPETNPGVIILLSRSWILANGADIILTVATADLTAGDVDFHCVWRPLSVDGKIVGL